MPSKAPGVLDAENQLLRGRVCHFFTGLTLASKFTAFDTPFFCYGKPGRRRDRRSKLWQSLIAPSGAIVDKYPAIGERQLQEAAPIGARLQAFNGPWQADRWRFFRCLGIYEATRIELDMLNRIYQFTRCIEGLIAAEQRRRQLDISSTERRIHWPARRAADASDLYAVRSDIEHLHEHKLLQLRDRAGLALRLAELEAVERVDCPSLASHASYCHPALMGTFRERKRPRNSLGRSRRRNGGRFGGRRLDPRTALFGFKVDRVIRALTLGLGAEGRMRATKCSSQRRRSAKVVGLKAAGLRPATHARYTRASRPRRIVSRPVRAYQRPKEPASNELCGLRVIASR